MTLLLFAATNIAPGQDDRGLGGRALNQKNPLSPLCGERVRVRGS